MLLHWRTNLADQNGQQPLKINVRVTYHAVLSVWNKLLIDTCQHCSTSRANQALRSLANAGFQNRGFCLQAFPSFSSPSPHFQFLALLSFLARPKPVFLCSESKRKRLLRRLKIYESRSADNISRVGICRKPVHDNLDNTELLYCMKTITYAEQTANSFGFSKLRLLFALLLMIIWDGLLSSCFLRTSLIRDLDL